MAGKSMLVAAAVAAGLQALAAQAAAQQGKVQILYGTPAPQAVSVTANEGGSRVTVARGPTVVAAVPPAREPVAVIDGLRIRLSQLEPVGDWFIDRSGPRPILVHCYTRQSTQVGGGRRILCDARRL